jgi:hypothetical protein
VSQPFEITDPDVEARRKERAIEYGTWECGDQPINFGNARAFNPGDPVPKSTVERFGLDTLGAVVKTGTYSKKLAADETQRQKLLDDAVKASVKEATARSSTTPRRRANAPVVEPPNDPPVEDRAAHDQATSKDGDN